MLKRLRAFVMDKKRMSHVTEGFGELFARAEDAGLFARAPAFIKDYRNDYPGLDSLESGFAHVRAECEALVRVRERMVDVENLAGKYTAGGIHTLAWKAFMFKSHRFIAENCALAPRTAELLRGIPGLYTAFFSVLEGHQYITPHWGYWKGFLRYHLGVIIPNNNADRACWLRVNADPQDNARHDKALIERGEKYYWHEGEGVMFDDTFLHDANNGSDEVRVVLWLDIRRKMPAYLNALNTTLLEIAHRAPSIAAVRKNAVINLAPAAASKAAAASSAAGS
ncbi:MAG TPA: aspartyl/asparaginyl beta-hydroxylase domain-containing protein [Polyangiaceae bacterium]|nr:aspartyl/asparaginyl beta-hydroxylase domain-containing protein [Polyangiaceae bacterium]